jgi:hypothetical protein
MIDPGLAERCRRMLGFAVCVLLGLSGCRPDDNPSGTSAGAGVASYGALKVNPALAASPEPARRPVSAELSTNAPLTVLQTELFPATLWRSRESRVRVFSDMSATGLGGATFVSYSSPTGIATLRPGDWLDGGQMRENWFLAGFSGAPGWTNWDSPWAVFLERRPKRVQLGTNGLELQFIGAARHFSLMPIYGYYKPPQEGHEFDTTSVAAAGKGSRAKEREKSGAGGGGRQKGERTSMKRPKLQVWEWPLAVARDPLTRLRYWAGATRRFPVRCEEAVSVDRERDVVTLRHRFDWLEIPDEWGTRPIRISPVSPTLALALKVGPRFPVTFSQPPFDFEIATPFGPFHGIPEADGYDASFPVLRYVNETETPAAPLSLGSDPTVVAAAARLRELVANLVSGKTGTVAAGTELSLARALPWLGGTDRTNATAWLAKRFREEILIPARVQDRAMGAATGTGRALPAPGEPGSGAAVNESTEVGRLLPALWAYVHFTGDHGLVRDRWSLIRSLFTIPARTRWAGFGGEGVASMGAGASESLAFARLAYLAGDAASYQLGCSAFARELVHLHVRQCGTAWFREQQPWHSMEAIDEDAVPSMLQGDPSGWHLGNLEGREVPSGRSLFERRWMGFEDPDVARFLRAHLSADVLHEVSQHFGAPEPSERAAGQELGEGVSRILLESLLVSAAPTNLARLAATARISGSPVEVLADCLAVLRGGQPLRFERLIASAPSSDFQAGLEGEPTGSNPDLVQSIDLPEVGVAAWPRVAWWGWRTPAGARWNFGEVRAGDDLLAAPKESGRVPLNRNTVRYEFR